MYNFYSTYKMWAWATSWIGAHDIWYSQQLTFFVTTEPRNSLLCTLTAYSIYLEWGHTK